MFCTQCGTKLIENVNFCKKCGCAIKNSKTLDDLTDALYSFLLGEIPEISEKIRDALVCDRIATNSSRGLPKSIYRMDANIGKIKGFLNSNPATAEKKGIRRNIAILYSVNKAVYADYDIKNYNDEYLLNFLEL